MKRTDIGILIALFAITCGVYAQGTAKPKVVVEQPTYDAGVIYRTPQRLEHAFIIKNTGTAELQILSAKPG